MKQSQPTANSRLDAAPEFILKLLKIRNITQREDIERFLWPQLSTLPKPAQMKNLEIAAEIIVSFMEAGGQIVVWGDYDVDGTTGTALLINFLKEFGIEPMYHIPDRLSEGYGLNSVWFDRNRGNFVSKNFLVITVDCGTSNHSEIEEIRALGGTVIVTDHHSIPDEGVPACVVVNPEQDGCGFKEIKLAGVGVAFYLAAAIKAESIKKNTFSAGKDILLKSYLGFVALGTVADMVELTDVNRTLVRGGMEALEDCRFPGLQALLESSEIYGDRISSEDIGFLVGPKINAAGRLGNSQVVVDLFISEDGDKDIPAKLRLLERLNKKRKDLCLENCERALGSIRHPEVDSEKCVIVTGDYHLGVAGIVSSRITEHFGVPSLVLVRCQGQEGVQLLKGSGRSIEGVDLISSLRQCCQLLEKFGGHKMAAGLTMKEENLAAFTEKFQQEIKKSYDQRQPAKRNLHEIECSVEEIMESTSIAWLSLMEPFGTGNEQPVFKDTKATVLRGKRVGQDKSHLTVMLRGKYSNHKGIGFGLGQKLDEIQEMPERQLLFSPTKNRFRGTLSWQVRVLSL